MTFFFSQNSTCWMWSMWSLILAWGLFTTDPWTHLYLSDRKPTKSQRTAKLGNCINTAPMDFSDNATHQSPDGERIGPDFSRYRYLIGVIIFRKKNLVLTRRFDWRGSSWKRQISWTLRNEDNPTPTLTYWMSYQYDDLMYFGAMYLIIYIS